MIHFNPTIEECQNTNPHPWDKRPFRFSIHGGLSFRELTSSSFYKAASLHADKQLNSTLCFISQIQYDGKLNIFLPFRNNIYPLQDSWEQNDVRWIGTVLRSEKDYLQSPGSYWRPYLKMNLQTR